MSTSVAHSRTHATSLLKGLRLLRLFSRRRPEWRVGEMSKAIGTAKSTVSRIARTLEAEGFLVRLDGQEGYRLGLRLWELGSVAIYEQAEFPLRALPHLERLAASLRETVHAAILDGAHVVYVQKVEASSETLRAYVPLGARFPAHCTATGKAMLAFQPAEVIDRVLGEGLQPYTSRTVTRPQEVRGELERIRKRGFALNKGEWRSDVGGIAAPVRDHAGRVIGAIGVTLPLVRYPRDVSSPAAQAIVAEAAQLSRALGFIDDTDHEIRAPVAKRPGPVRSRAAVPPTAKPEIRARREHRRTA